MNLNSKVDVSIIFVNYYTHQLVFDCISTIQKESKDFSYEIIVVDNSESIEEFKLLETNLKGVAKVIDAKKNLGFGKANNLGAKYSEGEALLFLNTDTLFINNAAFYLFDFLYSNPRIGAVGANLYTKDGKPNSSYFLPEKELKTENGSYFFHNIKTKFLRNYYFNKTKKPLKIKGFICGACLMIKRELFECIGGFDNDIFMYGEDALICHQIKMHGKLLYNVPEAKITHYEGASFCKIDDYKVKLIIDGNYQYYLKAFGKRAANTYLRNMIKKERKKLFVWRLLLKDKVKLSNIYLFLTAYKEKLNKESI